MDQGQTEAFSVRGFCQAFNISRAKLYHLWGDRRGPTRVRIDGKILIPRKDALRWLESLPEDRLVA